MLDDANTCQVPIKKTIFTKTILSADNYLEIRKGEETIRLTTMMLTLNQSFSFSLRL